MFGVNALAKRLDSVRDSLLKNVQQLRHTCATQHQSLEARVRALEEATKPKSGRKKAN